MNSSNIKKILILVTILAVPGFLYYLLQEKGKNRYKPLAIYGPKEVAKTFHSVRGKDVPDTIYHTIGDFKLTNQFGAPISWNKRAGKIFLIDLFHATDRGVAVDYASKAMAGFSKMYASNTMLHFLSVSINPTEDTPEVLKEYGETIAANHDRWDLLTGDSTAVYQLINKGLFLDAVKDVKGGETKFTYSNLFVLVDSQHRIRGYYEATNNEALSKLDDEIKVLIAEELRNMRDGR
ncbi:SCO family protein [Pedobacter insulae]|uniref:Protein SCO1/2 n=1 Tax=Pedobacter insulae TaxID=414048 RepID=A0A1I2TH21_9SPHI|nr:SCO family protein [Pedobacter insulae]SFG63369.1 protein SCO1/2 [Pedobacter insulae]